ncbi:hypothetical protein DPMN_142168 [Dreissena polymorpha]|uniref:Ig-like domain-containing protein n=1 Tax=Dreissena polymorpha TaxID=45954 RepID=A0A9D4GBB3_DREPO|nr:hypothetical protein DPMN_142168 [Dreissena polymorpha]
MDTNAEITDSTIRILRGDTVNIVCASDANPPAIVSWHGQLIMSPTLTLIRAHHDAVWACHATNYMTEFDNTTTTTTVTRNVSARVLCKNEWTYLE